MKRTRMKPVSDRRRKRDAVYPERRRQVYDRADGACEANFSPACTFACEQVHHIAGRTGSDPHRLSNLLGVCAYCHTAIHENPLQAREHGFMASRLTNPPRII